MPAIKGDMYINTHCNYSQPTLIKLYNENIGGHLTPLQTAVREMSGVLLKILELSGKSCLHICVHTGRSLLCLKC